MLLHYFFESRFITEIIIITTTAVVVSFMCEKGASLNPHHESDNHPYIIQECTLDMLLQAEGIHQAGLLVNSKIISRINEFFFS